MLCLKQVLLLLTILLAASNPGSTGLAQTSSSASEGVSVSGIGLFDRPIQGLFLQTADGQMTEIQIGIFAKGPDYSIEPTEKLVLYREEPNPDPESQKLMGSDGNAYKPVLQTELPSGSGDVAVAFHRDEGGKPAIRAINVSQNDFPPGSIILFNLSTAEIACKLNQDAIRLGPGEVRLSAFKPKEKTVFSYQYATQRENGELFKSLQKRLRLPRSDMRLSIFFADQVEQYDTGDGEMQTRLKVKDARIYDRVETPSPE